jgi:hypothetical protein
LKLQLPPDTFNYTLNFGDYWILDGSNTAGTESGGGFTPAVDQYIYPGAMRSLIDSFEDLDSEMCDVYMQAKHKQMFIRVPRSSASPSPSNSFIPTLLALRSSDQKQATSLHSLYR